MRNPIRVKTFSALLILSGASLILFVPQASAGTYCADGTYSYSSGKGTCSWHGGISGGAPSSKKSYGSSLNDPYGLNSYSNKKSYGSSLNDPYGLNSYSNSRTVKPYGGFGSGAPSRSQMDACAKSAASMYKCATGR
jgi:hypothetical protein